MTGKLFTILMIGLIFWFAFQEGILAFFATFCILGMICAIVEEARKEKEEEHMKEQETTV